MVKELTKENIDIINDSFIDKDYLLNEFNNNPFIKVLLLVESSKVIGYLYYSDIYDRVEINQIEVEVSHRNCGKGSLLMEYLTNNVDKNMTLEVNKNNTPAIQLYEKFNFKKRAIRPGYYNGVDGILMERIKDSKE